MAQPAQFDIDDAARIARAVRAVEDGAPKSRPLTFSPVLEPPKRLRLGSIQGGWGYRQERTVELTGSTQTVTVMNMVCGIGATAGIDCQVAIARHGSTWYLTQSDWTKYVGYNDSGTHSLVISDGLLKWTEIPNARMCSFAGPWTSGTPQLVTFLNSTNTVSVTNLVAPLSPSVSCEASIIKDGDAWYLAQPNWTKQPGYSTAGTHAITISSGSIRWTAWPTPVVRMAQYEGAWNQGASKTVALTNGATATVVVLNNIFGAVRNAATAEPCVVAQDNNQWYLLSVAEEPVVRRGTFSAPWPRGTSRPVSVGGGQTITADNRYAEISGAGTRNCTIARDGAAWEVVAADC